MLQTDDTTAGDVEDQRLMSISCGVTDHHDDECQETGQLDAEERKPNRYEAIGLRMRHVHQRLHDAGDQDNGAQRVDQQGH